MDKRDKEFIDNAFATVKEAMEQHSVFEKVTMTSRIGNMRHTFSLEGRAAREWNNSYIEMLQCLIEKHYDAIASGTRPSPNFNWFEEVVPIKEEE